MNKESQSILDLTEDIARSGLSDVRAYFNSPPVDSDGKGSGDRVDRALKLLGAYSRIRATRANEAAISVAIAKMSGIQGSALHGLFETLTGVNPSSLPAPGDRCGDAVGEAA